MSSRAGSWYTATVEGQTVELTSSVESHGSIELGKLFHLRFEKGLSINEIAAVAGISKQAVYSRLKRFSSMLGEPEIHQTYREHEASIFDSARMKLLANALDPRRLANAGTRDLIVSAGILFDKTRLIRGESTSNLSVHTSAVLTAHQSRVTERESDNERYATQGERRAKRLAITASEPVAVASKRAGPARTRVKRAVPARPKRAAKPTRGKR